MIFVYFCLSGQRIVVARRKSHGNTRGKILSPGKDCQRCGKVFAMTFFEFKKKIFNTFFSCRSRGGIEFISVIFPQIIPQGNRFLIGQQTIFCDAFSKFRNTGRKICRRFKIMTFRQSFKPQRIVDRTFDRRAFDCRFFRYCLFYSFCCRFFGDWFSDCFNNRFCACFFAFTFEFFCGGKTF